MKKIITAALALAMTLSMGTMSAFAATDNMTAKGNKDIDVYAVYSEDISVPTIYSVDLEWEAMEFTYSVAGTKNWNTDTKEYDVDTEETWSAEGNTVTVTNNSNAAVTAAFTFEPLAAYSTVNGSFSKTSVELASADKENVTDDELTGATALTLDGTLDKTVSALTNIGKVTVTIE